MHTCVKLAIVTYCWWAWFWVGHLFEYVERNVNVDIQMHKKWSTILYTHISLSTDNLVLSVYLVKVEENKRKRGERDTERKIDWHMYVLSCNRFFFSFLYVNIIYYDVPFANSLFFLCVLSFLEQNKANMLLYSMIILHNIIQMM